MGAQNLRESVVSNQTVRFCAKERESGKTSWTRYEVCCNIYSIGAEAGLNGGRRTGSSTVPRACPFLFVDKRRSLPPSLLSTSHDLPRLHLSKSTLSVYQIVTASLSHNTNTFHHSFIIAGR